METENNPDSSGYTPPDSSLISPDFHPSSRDRSLLIYPAIIAALLVALIFSFRLSPRSRTLPPPQQVSPTPQPTQTVPDQGASWKTYSLPGNPYTFSYPPHYFISTSSAAVEVTAPGTLCQDNSSMLPTEIIGRDLTITLKLHTGSNYASIWKDVFGFDLTGNSDGQILLDNHRAYYFYQGAEMTFGRTAYLVEISPTRALEINTYSPELVSHCQRPELVDKNRGLEVSRLILDSLRFSASPSSAPSPSPLPAGTNVGAGCILAGCSSEMCVDANSPEVASICVFMDKYSCLARTRCEKQSDGRCGWTQTPEYKACINNLSD